MKAVVVKPAQLELGAEGDEAAAEVMAVASGLTTATAEHDDMH